MNNFKKIDDESFFIVIDMPIGNTQCQKLFDLMQAELPYTVWNVKHDHYGSFIVELQDGVEQSDELYEKIWAAGEDLFIAMHNLQMFGEDGAFGMDVKETWDYVIDLNKICGYEYDAEDIIETVGYAGFETADIEKVAMLDKLAMETA